MLFQSDSADLVGTDFDLGLVLPPVEISRTAQSDVSSCCPNELQDRFVAPQGFAGPVGTDVIEQPMLNPIPLRRAGWIMCDGNRQAGFIRQLLQFQFPPPIPVAIGTATVGLDQQFSRSG